MPDGKKSFWTTVPGVISGIAAIVTALGVLVPILLGVGGKHTNKNAASQNSSPGVTSTAGTGATSPTAGGGTGDTASPLPTDSSSSSPLGITADPSTVNLGSGKASDATVTITNPGSTDVTFDKVETNGSNAAAFSVTSTTCGDGSTLSPKQSC